MKEKLDVCVQQAEKCLRMSASPFLRDLGTGLALRLEFRFV